MKDGKFTRCTKEDGLADEAIRVIQETHDGAVWVGTTNGLSRFSHQKMGGTGDPPVPSGDPPLGT